MTGVGAAFRKLADTLETIETDETVGMEYDITNITPVKDRLLDKESVSVEIEMLIPFLNPSSVGDGADLSLSGVEFTANGSLRVGLLATVDRERICEQEPGEPLAEESEDCGPESEVDEETRSVGDERKNGTRPDADSNQRAAVDQDTPAYRDPERLREVYEACDTFAEMTEALDVDVTPQTVRRYTIKHGLHEPSSKKNTAESLLKANPDSVSANGGERSAGSARVPPVGDGDALGERDSVEDATTEDDRSDGDSANDGDDRSSTEKNGRNGTDDFEADDLEAKPAASADDEETSIDPDGTADELDDRDAVDIDLPDHLSLDEVKEIVRGAKTLYEAQQGLKLDRDEARQLLRDLNLLNLVHGRLSTHLEEHTIDEINRRIRSATVRQRA